VPDATHEAVRDLARAREGASEDPRKKRQQLLAFLLRHGRIFSDGKHWTLAHLRWLARRRFEHPAQQIVFQDAVDAIEDGAKRLRILDQQLAAIVPSWSMAPVVAAFQAMRGVSFLVAVTFVAEIGDVRRFDNPRQLMSFLGLVPSERSTGEAVRRAGLTLAGNRRAGRVLIEGAWAYRYPARVSETLRARLEGLPKAVRDIAWKGQVRLCARYRRLIAVGKKPPVVIAAIAREMAAFLWAVGHQVRTADLNRTATQSHPTQGWGWSHGGEPLARLRGRALPDARLLDAGTAPRRNTEGGSQPADKSLIDRRLKRSISCPVQSQRKPTPVASRYRRTTVLPKALTTDIRV
jgi:transposase